MNHKEEKIKITESGVITEEAVLAYLRDQLSPDDRQEIERLLKEDPFAQEAFEGLKNARDKAAMTDSLLSIRKKIHQRIDKKEKKLLHIHWTNYAWAAVILGLLISLGSIMVSYLGKRNENLAFNNSKEQSQNILEQKKEEPKIAPAPLSAADSAALNAKASEKTVGNISGSTEPVRKEENQILTGKKKEEQKIIPVPATGGTTAQGAPINTTQTENTFRKESSDDKFKVNSAGTGAMANDTTHRANMARGTASKLKADKSMAAKTTLDGNVAPVNKGNVSGLFDSNASYVSEETTNTSDISNSQVSAQVAMKTFYTGDYKKSEEQFDEVLKQQPENPEALFFGGISDYVNGDLKKGEKNFDQLLKQHKKFMDGAKWYKAKILLKEGDKQQAKKMLEELSRSGGSYKERAQKKLSETIF